VRRTFVPSPFALASWIAVPLVAAKAFHWGWPGSDLGDWEDWFRDVTVSSAADIAFAAGFGVVAVILLRLSRRWAAVERGVGFTLLALGTFCALYAVASAKIFDFLRSPLTYPLLYLAGDMRSMRSSIGSFLTPAVMASFVAVTTGYVAAVWFTSGHPGSGGRFRRALPLATLLLALRPEDCTNESMVSMIWSYWKGLLI